MRTVGRKFLRKHWGSSRALCATCGSMYSRKQLVRGTDGMLRCSGPGTVNDAKGRTAKELDELVSLASLAASQSTSFEDNGPYQRDDEII